jgi:hypothetical protein
MYVVKAQLRNAIKMVDFGPFASQEAAESCAVALAARRDCQGAVIVPAGSNGRAQRNLATESALEK